MSFARTPLLQRWRLPQGDSMVVLAMQQGEYLGFLVQQQQQQLAAMVLLVLLLLCFSSSSSVVGVEGKRAWSVVLAETTAGPADAAEAATLLELRGALGIRSRYWPRKVDPCAEWDGVRCESGHVVSISLSGLRRTVSAARNASFALDPLRNLTRLASFNSSGFALPGAIPEWFGALSSLQELDLSSASIYAPLPESIGNLTNLTVVAIANNNLSGPLPSSLIRLQQLRRLDLASNRISGSIPAPFAPALQSLNLSFNSLSGTIPASLGLLSSLQSLSLSGNNLNGSIPPELSNCTSLTALFLDANSLSGSLPPSLGSLFNLTTLNLSSNHLTGTLPAGFLSGLAQAERISLSQNLFYGPLSLETENLTHIVELDLSGNYFEGAAPSIAGALLDMNCFADGLSNQREPSACEQFYADRGLAFQGFGSALGDESGNRKENRLALILGTVFGGLVLMMLIVGVVAFVIVRRRRSSPPKTGEATHAIQKSAPHPFSGRISVNLLCLGETFSYAQLKQATREFSGTNLLKEGHSGDLYRGLLEGEVPVVVKRIVLDKVGNDGYLAELDFFGKASHTRLVPLLGHCLELESEKLLVYKYMPGHDLGSSLHRSTEERLSQETLKSLDWITRLKIAIGAAEALTYLHHECTPPLVHRDVQASSILLDSNFEVRLGSLSEACVAVSEPHHGVIARMLRRSQTSDRGEAGVATSTCAYDVYCFGKVLLELVSGKLGISGSKDASGDAWLEWALAFIDIYNKESVVKIVDPSLIVDDDLMEEVWSMSIVAKSCLQPKPSKRPLMRHILKALENPFKVVREDANANVASERSRTSSHGSWNAAIFGSWHNNSSDRVIIPGSLREEYMHKNALKQISHGSGPLGEMSQRRPGSRPGSSEIFPEPLDDNNITNSDKQEP